MFNWLKNLFKTKEQKQLEMHSHPDNTTMADHYMAGGLKYPVKAIQTESISYYHHADSPVWTITYWPDYDDLF